MSPIGFKAHTWPVPGALLGPESVKYQDSARTTLAVNDGDPVGSWSTLYGTNHASQATSANRPVLRKNVLNGFDVIETDGVNDSLTASMTALSAFTMFVVAKKVSAPSGSTERTLLGLRVSSTRLRPMVNNFTGDANYMRFFTTDALAYIRWDGSDVRNWAVYCFTALSTASCKLWAGGGAASVFDPHDAIATMNLYQLGADNTTGFGDYQIAEVRRYTALSIEDTNLVGGALAKKYALAWAQAA